MVSKRDLGIGYLIAVGIGLFGSLTSGILIPADTGEISLDPSLVFALVFAGMVVSGFVLSGIGLARSELDDERIWRIAQWSTLGLGISILPSVALLMTSQQSLEGLDWEDITIVTVAIGGIIGILVGAILELRAEHSTVKTLNQRNTVFLRLLRHDIRTSVNVIQEHVRLLTTDPSSPSESVAVIDDRLEHILRLSTAARRLDRLEDMESATTVDLASVVTDRLDELRQAYPEVDVETDIERETYVSANDLLSTVVDNLLRNAIEHNDNDNDPWLCVTVRPVETRDRVIELRIRDNGPGFSEDELAVHSRTVETKLHHSDGIGLWLAQWIIDACGGEVSIENTDRGALVTVRLPAVPSDS